MILSRRSLRCLGFALACCAAFGPLSLSAQEASPINDLLTQARNALNDLRFERADTLALEILGLGDRLRRSQRILAYQIRAAAAYPEEGGERDADAARRAFREAVALDLDADLPEDIRWSGLDALLGEVKQTSFGLAVRIPREYTYGGDLGPALVRVITSQPASVVLRAVPRDGGPAVLLDSLAEIRDSTLRIVSLRGTDPVLPSGAWTLEVTARSIRDTLTHRTRRFAATSTNAPLALLPPFRDFDATQLRIEQSRTTWTEGVTGATAILAGSIILARSLKPQAPLGGTTWSPDSRATTVGVLGAIGTLVAVYFDRGRPLPKNIEYNRVLRGSYEDSLQSVQQENARRAVSHRALLSIDVEDR